VNGALPRPPAKEARNNADLRAIAGTIFFVTIALET